MEREGGRSRGSNAFVAALVLVPILSALGVLATGCGPGGGQSKEAACAARVVEDWRSDGRIDGLYAGSCYLGVLAALPEDVRTYTSAADDITRAMQAREAATPSARRAVTQATPTRTQSERRLSGEEATALAVSPAAAKRALPGPIVAIAALAVALAAIASIAFVARRAHRGR